jgi:cell division septation protein DedD
LRRLLLLALLCTACSNDRAAPDSASSHIADVRGNDVLLLRTPRKGGLARVYLYPKLDSAVWTDSAGPSLERVLAFDPDAGTIAFVDSRGLPGRIDLRMSEVRTATRTKLSSLSSANGTDIYGIDAKGQVLRLNPNGGDWKFKPVVPARTVFAQPNGELIIAANKGAQTLLWKVRPPDEVVQDSAVLPLSGRGVRTQVGDRVYFTVDSGLVGVRAKDLSPVGAVKLASPVLALAPTPSGDRLYVATAGDSALSVIDRYSESGQTRIALPRPPVDLRMDGLGRYLLARFPKADSAWVIAIGTNRLVGAVPTRWETDLPAVTPDGMLAVLGSKDVDMVDPENLNVKSTVVGGARDFWYFFAWDGFRPRAQGLDQPVTFPGDSAAADSATASSTVSTTASSSAPILPQTTGQDSARAPGNATSVTTNAPSAGFTVSFAALLSEEKAQQLASSIKVNGSDAHVVSTTTAGSPIFRVVMGPFPTREEADRVGRASKREYWIYEGSP